MNELRRIAYLEVLGVDNYISRRQLPGASVTHRLTIVPTRQSPMITVGLEALSLEEVAPQAPPQSASRIRPDISLSPRAATETPAPAAADAPGAEPVPRFSLCTMVAGDWLWLQDLGDLPLTAEQVQLVQAMANALRRASADRDANSERPGATGAASKPDVAQFDWPMHTNRQLDLGEEAARASVAAFVSRRLEQHGCRGVVLLGQSTAGRVSVSEIAVCAVQTASSSDILARPTLKPQVWRDLQPLRDKA